MGVENNYKLGKARRHPEGAGLKARAGCPPLEELETPRLGVREGLRCAKPVGRGCGLGC